VTLSVGATEVSEGGPQNSTTVTATLSNITSRYVVVNLKRSGSADYRYDYRLASMVIVPEGSLEASIPLTVVDDTLHEISETVMIAVDTVTNGTHHGTQQQTVMIVDDDPAPMVTLSVAHTTALETPPEDRTTLTARLSAQSGLDVMINLVKSGTAADKTDYTLADQIMIPAGDFFGSAILAVLSDTLIEGNETVTVDVATMTNARSAKSSMQTVKIVDVPPPSVLLSVEDLEINESGISNRTKVTATLSIRSTLDVIVTLDQSGSATLGSDYTLADRIVVPAGRLSASTALTAIADHIVEEKEMVTVDIGGVQNGVKANAQPQRVVIYNND
jgi:hypothetical protein